MVPNLCGGSSAAREAPGTYLIVDSIPDKVVLVKGDGNCFFRALVRFEAARLDKPDKQAL